MEMIPLITRRRDPAGNPGDAYICLGLQWLISQVIKDPKFLLVDKFVADDFKVYEEPIKEAGYVVYAGTPQYNNLDDWCFWYDWDMFRDYIIPWKLRFNTLAGGSGCVGTTQTPRGFSRHLLQHKPTASTLKAKQAITNVCTVRDEHSYQLLKDLGQANLHLLPCTATWSTQWLGLKPVLSKTVGLVPPSLSQLSPDLVGCRTQKEATAWFVKYLQRITNKLDSVGYSTVVICHGLTEYKVYSQFFKHAFYSNDLVSLLKVYESLHGVISTRLHGAIPTVGMQGKRALLLGIDTRHSAADVLGMPKLLLGVDNSEEAVARYLLGPDDYTSVLAPAQEQYLELLSSL